MGGRELPVGGRGGRMEVEVGVGEGEEGAGALAMAGVPRGAWVGLGLVRYEAGPRLAGRAGVPPGLHLLHGGRGEGGAEGRHGRLLMLAPDALLPLRWDPDAETLRPDPTARGRAADARAAGGARGLLGAGFGPFDHRRNALWEALVSHVGLSMLRRCLPREEQGGGATESQQEDGQTSEEVLDASLVSHTDFDGGSWVGPLLGAGARREFNFTPAGLPRGLSGAEITRWHTEGAARLERLVRDGFGGDFQLLLGELQLSFVAFLQLSDLAALEQWKSLAAAACGGEDWLRVRPGFLRMLSLAMLDQLRVVDVDLFQNSVLGEGGFLRSALCGLAATLRVALTEMEVERPHSTVDGADVRGPAVKLQDLLRDRFGVALMCVPGTMEALRGLLSLEGGGSDEEGEDGPTVVDLAPPESVERPLEPLVEAPAAVGAAPMKRMDWMLH